VAAAGALALALMAGAVRAQAPTAPAKDARVLLTIPFEDREAMMVEMRNNLEQVRRLFVAYVNNDFVAIEKIADEISIHKKRAQVVVRRGDPTYTAMAVNFHAGHSMAIRDAARSKDSSRVAAAIDVALQACVACHATYRLTEWPDNKTYSRPAPIPLVLPPGATILE
jgi:cytochrome c556